MAKLIVAIDISTQEAFKIERQAKRKSSIKFDKFGIPEGYFNPDGRISIRRSDLEPDVFDTINFVTFDYVGVKYDD